MVCEGVSRVFLCVVFHTSLLCGFGVFVLVAFGLASSVCNYDRLKKIIFIRTSVR